MQDVEKFSDPSETLLGNFSYRLLLCLVVEYILGLVAFESQRIADLAFPVEGNVLPESCRSLALFLRLTSQFFC